MSDGAARRSRFCFAANLGQEARVSRQGGRGGRAMVVVVDGGGVGGDRERTQMEDAAVADGQGTQFTAPVGRD